MSSRLLVRLAAAAVAALACAPSVASAASTCAARGYAITPLQSNTFYIDVASRYLGSYVGYGVRNSTGASRSELWLRLESFSGGRIAPATGAAETSPVPLGTVASGASTPSYAYLTASAATTAAQSHDVVLYSGRPGAGGTEVCRETQTISSVQDVIKAAANKVTSASGPSTAALGSTFTITVNGATGQIGSGIAADPGVIRFSPAVAAGWPSDAFRLIGVSHRVPADAPPAGDLLSLSNMSGADRPYTVTYTFRVVGPTSAPTPIVPVQNIASGTQVKHTDPGSFATLAPIPVVTSTATIAVAAGGTAPYPSGTRVPLSATITNTGSSPVSLDEVTLRLPATWTAATGSWTRDGAALAEPFDAGAGTLRIAGPFQVAAGSTSTFRFDATAGDAGTSGSFSAVGRLAGGQVDSTLDPADDRPSAVTLRVLGAPRAADDTMSVASGVERDLDVLANDDLTGSTPTLTVISGPANGTATVVGERIRYRSADGYVGNDSFVYRVTTAGGEDTATVTVTSAAPPAAPAPPDRTSTGAGTAPQTTTLPTPDGGSVTLLHDGAPATTLSVPGEGTYALDPATGIVTFDPVLGFHGRAAGVAYRVTDAFGQSGEATYRPTVTAPAAPSPADLTSTAAAPAPQSVTIEVPARGSVTLLDGDATATDSVAAEGEGTYTLDRNDGRLTFEPAAGFSGAARGVLFRVTDAYGQSATATYRPTVTLPPAPDAPTVTSTGTGIAAHTQTLGFPPGGGVTLIGPGGAAALAVTVDGEGTYALDQETGVVTFTPVLGFSGSTSIAYRVTDAYGQATAGSYRPTVHAPAPAPAVDVASSGIGTQPQHEILAIPAGATVTLLDALGRPVSSLLVPGEGIYTLDAQTGAVSFVPLLGFRGTATAVVYRITDAYGQRSEATYRATVTAPAPAVAPAQSSSGAAGVEQAHAIPVPEGGSISLVDADGRSTSTLRIEGIGTYAVDAASGIVTFTPDAAFGGTPPPVLYRITDAYGQVSEGTYSVTVVVTDAAPAAGAAPPAAGAAPAAAPAPAPGAAAVCASRRKMVINWIVKPRVRLRRIVVTVNGERTASLSGRARRTTVDMRGRPAQIVKVVVTGTTTTGRRIATTRTYRTCVPSQSGPRLPTLRLR